MGNNLSRVITIDVLQDVQYRVMVEDFFTDEEVDDIIERLDKRSDYAADYTSVLTLLFTQYVDSGMTDPDFHDSAGNIVRALAKWLRSIRNIPLNDILDYI